MSDQFDAKAFLKTVTSQPGVYRMYDAGGTVILTSAKRNAKNGFPAISVATSLRAKPKRWSPRSSKLM
ncbi:hypothetical protein ACLB1M_15595 [Escherichia coli]